MSKQKVKEDFIVTAFFENMDGGVPNIYIWEMIFMMHR